MLAVAIALPMKLQAQVTFQRPYNDSEGVWEGFTPTSDNGYAYTKSKENGTQNPELWLVKTDSFGEIEWQKKYSFGAGMNKFSFVN